MAIGYNPFVASTGLVFCLDAGNVKSYPGSGTTWYDLCGGKNDLTLINSPTYSSSNGGCLIFDGVNNYAYRTNTSCSSDFKNLSAYTSIVGLEVLNTDLTAWHQLYGFGDGDNLIDMWYQSGTGNFGSDSHSHYPTQGTMGNLNPRVNIWSHSTTHNGSGTSKIYRNGVLIDSKSIANTITTASQDFCIGAQPETKNYRTNMKMSFLYIYNKVLTDSEITQNFNALRGRFGI